MTVPGREPLPPEIETAIERLNTEAFAAGAVYGRYSTYQVAKREKAEAALRGAIRGALQKAFADGLTAAADLADTASEIRRKGP